jgi:hypothetical protein
LAPALGVKLALIEDPEALELLNRKFPKRELKVPARSVPWGRSGKHTASLRFIKRIAREGGKARALKLTPAQRSRIAREAALQRWAMCASPRKRTFD